MYSLITTICLKVNNYMEASRNVHNSAPNPNLNTRKRGREDEEVSSFQEAKWNPNAPCYLTNLPREVLAEMITWLNWREKDMAFFGKTCKLLKSVTEAHPKYALAKIFYVLQQCPFLYSNKIDFQANLFETIRKVFSATLNISSKALNLDDFALFRRLVNYTPFTALLQQPSLSEKEFIFPFLKQMIEVYDFGWEAVLKVGKDDKVKEHVSLVFQAAEQALQLFNKPIKDWKKEEIEKIDWDSVIKLLDNQSNCKLIQDLNERIGNFFETINNNRNELVDLYKSGGINEKFILFLMFCSERILNEEETTRSLFLIFQDKVSDRDFVLKCVRVNPRFTLPYVLAKFSKDREIVLEAVKSDGRALEYAPDFWGDQEIVMEAVKTYGAALERAVPALLNNRVFFLEACKIKDEAPMEENFPEQFANDREYFLEVVENDVTLLAHASLEIRDYDEFMYKAVKCDARAYTYGSNRLKRKRDFALLAVRKEGRIIDEVSNYFPNDEEMILEAIESDIYVLTSLSVRLLTNNEFMMKVFRKNCHILTYADGNWLKDNTILKEMIGDRAIILEAIQNKYFISNRYVHFLSKAPKHIRSDRELMLAAIQRCIKNIEYIDESLWDDPLFIEGLKLQNKFFENFINHRATPLFRARPNPTLTHFDIK